MSDVTIGDVRLSYDSAGTGEPLVLIHSYPTNAKLWGPQIAALSSKRRVITYDVRGFGRSDAPKSAGAYSQERSIADLLALLDALGIDKADLCGSSMGGNIALNFALTHPKRVARLIAMSTGAGTGDGSAFAKICNGWADTAERDGIEGFAREMSGISIFSEYGNRGPAEKKIMWDLITANTAHGVAHTAREVLAKRPTIDALIPTLKALAVPTSIVAGSADTACVSAGQIMAEHIPGARVQIIPKTGHFCNLEEPDTVNRMIGDFLAAAR